MLQLLIDSLLKNEKINLAYEKTEYAISLWNKHEKELASEPNPSSIPSKFSFYYDQFLCCMYSDILYSQKDDIAQSAINCINDAHIPEQDFSQYKNLLSLWGTSLIRDKKYNKGFEITKKYLNHIDIENEKNQFTEIAIHSMINYYTYKNDLEMVNYYKNVQENLFD